MHRNESCRHLFVYRQTQTCSAVLTNWQKMGDTVKPTVKVLNEQPKAGKSDLKAPDLAKKLQKKDAQVNSYM